MSDLAGPFDLEIQPGEAVAISGASGSGKSLFLRMVADLDLHTGEVSLDGVRQNEIAAPVWRRRAPYVAAESGWWADGAADHFPAARRVEARALARRLGISSATFDGPVGRLSTGERQRLSLVRALALNPPLLLLDEPTGPLDPESVSRVEAVLRARLAQGAMILMVSHDPLQAARLGAAGYRMVQRRLQAQP